MPERTAILRGEFADGKKLRTDARSLLISPPGDSLTAARYRRTRDTDEAGRVVYRFVRWEQVVLRQSRRAAA